MVRRRRRQPLGRQLAEQCDAVVDRAGRISVEDDLSLPGHPNVFVVGDMMSLDRLPGVAPVAIQGGRYAARTIITEVAATAKDRAAPERTPFDYRDKGSMATISRFNAVAAIASVELSGFFAWVMWLGVHVAYLVGFRSRIATVLSWTWTFLGSWRGQMTTTEQQTIARNALGELHHLRTLGEDTDDVIARVS